MAEEEKNTQQEEKKGNKGKVAVVSTIALLALLGGGGGLAYYFNSPTHHRNETEENVQKVAETPVGETSKASGFGSDKDKNKKAKISYDPSSIKGIPSLDELDKLQDDVISGKEPVVRTGNISIPQLDIQSPIYEGTSPYTLAVGVGTAKPNQVMGKGNYAIAGHNMIKSYGLNNYFFTNFETHLPNDSSGLSSALAKTDGLNAYLAGKSHVYVYKLKQSELVPYTNGRVILDSTQPFGKNVPTLTLYTCGEVANTIAPYYRIVVQGKLTHKYTIKEFKQKYKKYSGIFEQPTWLKH